ncbi:MAG TPA: ATP-binding protein [Microvirga sp.]|jgi:anti-sigma regulatory factor (Ser/Thr protein kinase)|nr:ATP-binding protein [Microvirga sp.]
MQALPVQDLSQVAEARRGAATQAQRMGFSEEEVGRVAIVATELATNLVKHGGGGELVVGAFEDGSGDGIECLALDKGPGMADVDACLRDGYSTTGTAGTGLGAVARQSQLLDIFSRPGLGTAALVRLQRGRRGAAPPPAGPAFGAVSLPKHGEEACGDSWSARPHPDGLTLMVVDGLGHGPLAAEAAHAAGAVFDQHHERDPAEILDRIHGALRATRGAAVSVARVDLGRSCVHFAGIGNVAGTLLAGSVVRKMVSHNGTAGHAVKRIQAFTYGFEGPPTVILCSDGLGTNWALDRYPGLAVRHPSLVAGVLYRDFTRGRDDVTVLVATGGRA